METTNYAKVFYVNSANKVSLINCNMFKFDTAVSQRLKKGYFKNINLGIIMPGGVPAHGHKANFVVWEILLIKKIYLQLFSV